ncbi:MAG: hypothetical protein V3T55_07040 [Anaerolineales bacterium]
MTATEVRIGRYYATRISGNMTIVKIEAGSSRGGWTGKNIFTNRRVRSTDHGRLLGDVTARGERVERDMKELGL